MGRVTTITHRKRRRRTRHPIRAANGSFLQYATVRTRTGARRHVALIYEDHRRATRSRFGRL
jgi:hypothetical protein